MFCFLLCSGCQFKAEDLYFETHLHISAYSFRKLSEEWLETLFTDKAKGEAWVPVGEDKRLYSKLFEQTAFSNTGSI